MSNSQTVTDWLRGIEAGNAESVNRLVERYLKKLVGVARKEYHKTFEDIPRPAEDEEDAALSALDSFCARLSDGRIQGPLNRYQLWTLLVKIAIRKVIDQRERATAQKRGGKKLAASAAELEYAVSNLPDAQVEAELADTYRAAMDALLDPALKRIAAMDLDGRSRPEIAEALGMTERTVYRKLELIHEKWDGLAALWGRLP